MLGLGLVPPRVWMRPPIRSIFFVVLALLRRQVPFAGVAQLGARRWLGHGRTCRCSRRSSMQIVAHYPRRWRGTTSGSAPPGSDPLGWLLPPLDVSRCPLRSCYAEPDLGTALLMSATAAAVLFLSGIAQRGCFSSAPHSPAPPQPSRGRMTARTISAAASPRLDPSLDPLGAGYHITQSKIALGSRWFFRCRISRRHAGAAQFPCPKSQPISSSRCWPKRPASSARRCWWCSTPCSSAR